MKWFFLIIVVILTSCHEKVKVDYHTCFLTIEDDLKRLMAERDIPAIQLEFFSKDSTIYQFCNGVKATGGDSINEQTLFESASLSKQYFSYLVTHLIANRDIGWDTKMEDLLASNILSDDAERSHPQVKTILDYLKCDSILKHKLLNTTVVNLLSHQAGFLNWQDTCFEIKEKGKFCYSGEGYIALWRFLSLQTNIDSLYKECICNKIGLHRTFFKDGFKLNCASGHNKDGDFVRAIWRSKASYPHGSLCASSFDIAKFYRYILTKQEEDKDLKKWNTPSVKLDGYDNLYWSPGWGIEIYNKDTLVWQWGNDRYYQHLAIFSLKNNKGVIYQSNSQNGLSIGPEIVEMILGYCDLELFDFISPSSNYFATIWRYLK